MQTPDDPNGYLAAAQKGAEEGTRSMEIVKPMLDWIKSLGLPMPSPEEICNLAVIMNLRARGDALATAIESHDWPAMWDAYHQWRDYHGCFMPATVTAKSWPLIAGWPFLDKQAHQG